MITMAYFCSCALGLQLVACLFTAAHGTSYPDTIYVGDKCQQTFRVWGDVKIKLTSMHLLPSNTTCTLKLQRSTGTRLLARFRNYYMNPDYVNEYGNCAFESIQLYDYHDQSLLSASNKGYCGMATPISLFDLGDNGKFSYSTYQQQLIVAAEVELLVTEVKDKQGSSCPGGYFDCYYNGYCVSNDLTCNGYDDCGNNRDETVGCAGLAVGAIVGIALGLIAAFCCIAVIIFCVFRSRARRHYQHF